MGGIRVQPAQKANPLKGIVAKLGAKNGVAANLYTFYKAKLTSASGSHYSKAMLVTCASLDMKPICDYPVIPPPSLVIPPPSLVNNPPSLVNNPPSLCK